MCRNKGTRLAKTIFKMHAFKDIKIHIKQLYLRQRGHGQREGQTDNWDIIYISETEAGTAI